jgi:hypothetical protein
VPQLQGNSSHLVFGQITGLALSRSAANPQGAAVVAQSLSGVTMLESASTDTFKQLIRDFPNSVWVPPARMAIALQADIARLQTDKLQRDDRIRQLNTAPASRVAGRTRRSRVCI